MKFSLTHLLQKHSFVHDESFICNTTFRFFLHRLTFFTRMIIVNSLCNRAISIFINRSMPHTQLAIRVCGHSGIMKLSLGTCCT
jgi:hypothetical protein